jgi:hypothetical protein
MATWSAVVSSAVAVGLLLVAIAQWTTTSRQTDIAQKQTDISDRLQKLEYARSSPRFDFQLSAAQTRLGADYEEYIDIPSSIRVSPLNGVSAISDIDGSIQLTVIGSHSAASCDINIGEIYLNEQRTLSALNFMVDDLRKFVAELEQRGMRPIAATPMIALEFDDLLGQHSTKQYMLSRSGPLERRASPLEVNVERVGRALDQRGFRAVGDPSKSCPIGDEILAALKATQ